MRNGEFENIRKRAVASYMDTLADVEQADAPRWLLTLCILPVWLWEVFKTVLGFGVGVMVSIGGHFIAMLIAPFAGLYAMVDTLWLMTWFFARIIDKMVGEEK